jgi:VanZ family protein
VVFQRLARAAFTIGTIGIIVVSLLPAEELPSIGLWDKLEHAIAYATVAALGGLAWAGRARAWAAIGIALVTLGVVLEILQSMVPGRTTDPADAAANLVGTLLGLGMIAALGRIAGRASRLGEPGR